MGATTFPIRRTRTRRLRGLAVLGSALIALSMVAGPVSATVDRDPPVVNEPYAFDAWDCGYLMRVEGVQSHRVHVRTDRRVDGNFFFTDNYRWRETWTAEDGRSFTLSAASRTCVKWAACGITFRGLSGP